MLTPKQKAFADEYCIDKNATQAAIRAGYSEKTANEQGARLLANVSVKAYVSEKLKKLSERTDITAEWVLNQIKENAELAKQNGEYQASTRALELLGKNLQLFTDKMQLQGNLDIAVTIVDDIDE